MPEGHTIHRLARSHREALGGRVVATGSPQGRFAAGARQLNGRTLEAVDAHGKHLFYRWEGDEVLHVHLGLYGKFKLHRADPPPPPTENTRLTMQADGVTIYLAGPSACELITPEEKGAIRARLGPDPLRNGSTHDKLDRFRTNLAKRRIPIGAALLDQKVVAGIGNVYRAEVLFLAGIDPHIPANELTPDEVETTWDLAAAQLKLGVKAGRIITVDPADVGARRRSSLERHERLYVYKRQGEPCRRCQTPISMTQMANRSIWWCPSCQANGSG